MSAGVRVALVGCGRIARVHRAYLRHIPEVQLIGACDVDSSAAQRFAAETGLRPFESLEALLSERPDVCHVLTPPQTHADVAIRCLQAGANVLVEKPLALSAREADVVCAEAERAGRWVTVDHNRWFDPVVQRAARELQRGSLGRLVGVELFQGAEVTEEDYARQPRGHWALNLPGGILHNLAPHPLYLMRRFAGVVRSMRIVATTTASGMLEEVRVAALGESAPALVSLSLRARPFTTRVVLWGDRKSAEIDLNNMTLIWRTPRRLPKLAAKVWPNVSVASQMLAATVRNGLAFLAGRQRFYPGIGAHLRALYAAVAAGQPPPVSAEEGRDVVAWYDEILREAGLS